MIFSKLLLGFAAVFNPISCGITRTPSADKITSLPGLSTMPSFDMYSGYLNVTSTKMLHYWFVQSQSNPATDPVVLWLNGGPGCSSMEGFMAEHGPLHLNDDDSISMNPYAWNKKANMIYMEAPIGVGFSKTREMNNILEIGDLFKKGSPEDMKHIDDDQTASDNRDALKAFFQKFPQYLDNGLFVSGESYAGIYVPTLIAKIVDDPVLMPHFKVLSVTNSTSKISRLFWYKIEQKLTPSMKGAIIGNGLYSWEKNQDSIVKFSKYHGLIDLRTWSKVIDNCCQNGDESKCDFFNYPNKKCQSLVEQIVDQTWSSGLDVYNLYAECAGGISRNQMMKRIAQQAVKAAIHVDPSITWTLCADDLDYTTTVQDVSQYIHHALNVVSDARVALYAGDVDMACNFLGGEMFAEALGLPLISEYQAWNYVAADSTTQIGGYIKQFDRLTWLTVKGAGHMVPTDKPIQAYAMFEAFLMGKI